MLHLFNLISPAAAPTGQDIFSHSVCKILLAVLIA
nr:MAG TPA: hypothetical protein [Caudoviricetes sp.]DAY58089.1 MAG TPA: hypothetical protein [Caudoviricetes sp.]